MTGLKLWKIEQTANCDWDIYDSAVVVAKTEDDARDIYPDGGKMDRQSKTNAWARFENVYATYLGEAAPGLEEGSVIVASYNAG